MTERRSEQLQRLGEIQNRPEHECHDIMTITGFMDDDQVEQHIADNDSRKVENFPLLINSLRSTQ